MTDHSSIAADRRGTMLIGGAAILLWSSLGLLSSLAGAIPPFQMVAMTFGLAGVCGTAFWLARACIAIVGGATLAARDLWSRPMADV